MRLKSLVEESYPQVDFNVAFKSLKTIGSLFPFEKTSQSFVVFKISCKTCNVDYMGKTERFLVHRLKEHKKKKQTTNKSACYEHIEENPTREMDYYASRNFKIKNEGTITYSEKNNRN